MTTTRDTQRSTICAPATQVGGAIAVIRLSGEDALTIADSIFRPVADKPLAEHKGYTIARGTIVDGSGNAVDDVLASIFRAPHSYTGEDCVELSCHASTYIVQRVLELLCHAGCRPAEPGEFTRRAFLNGKMDLSQAEAVADLIASSSAAAHRLAINQMRGGFSRKLSDLRERLLHLTTLLELELDFSDHEDIEFADRSELIRIADEARSIVSRLADSFSLGNAIKNGVPVAIIGETNVGKSTLLNALVGEDKAIVSDIHGTTRDVIEDAVVIDGVTFRFIDTAGIRQTTDAIETMGIERSFRAMDGAQIVILMQDLTQKPEAFFSFVEKVKTHLQNKQVVVVQNKYDRITLENHSGESNVGAHPCGRPSRAGQENIPPFENTKSTRDGIESEELSTFNFQLSTSHRLSTFNFQLSTVIPLSAKHGTNIDALRTALVKLANLPEVTAADVVVTNIRHYEALTHAQEAIIRVKQGLDEDLPTDLVSQDLRDCSYHLGSIIGDVSAEDVLENIFSHFCIGK